MSPTPIICWFLLLHEFVHSSVSSSEQSDATISSEKNSGVETDEELDSNEPNIDTDTRRSQKFKYNIHNPLKEKDKSKHKTRSDHGFFSIEPNFDSNEPSGNYFETDFDSDELMIPYNILQERDKIRSHKFNSIEGIHRTLEGFPQQKQFNKASKINNLLRSIDGYDYNEVDLEVGDQRARARYKNKLKSGPTPRPRSLQKFISEHLRKQKRHRKKQKYMQQLSMLYDWHDNDPKDYKDY